MRQLRSTTRLTTAVADRADAGSGGKGMLERFHVPEADRVYVRQEKMRAATEAVFLKMGLSDQDAALSTDVLMLSDLRGCETHGVSNMLRVYVRLYRAGQMNPRPNLRVTRESAATATMDADGGLGLHTAPKAMELAIEKAEAHGTGAVTVHGAKHLGMCAYHAMMALDHDMIGVCMTGGGGSLMLPTFGAETRFGTNPIAWAAPAGKMPPFVFDVATTQVAANKLGLAQRIGAPIHSGWLAGPDGAPIMEEAPLPEAPRGPYGPTYTMLPMGGTRENGSHKGYGFASVVDVMCCTLSGSGPGFLNPGKTGHYFAAYKIDAFMDVAQFKDDMDALLEGLANTKPAPGHDRVYYAGLPEAEETERRLAEGIPYHREVIEWFESAAADLDLEFDLP